MASKRGLSEVVTAVILILLVLAAIAILWSFLRPTIQGAAEQASASCVTLDVEVTGCNSTSNYVTVKRNVGSGDLTGYKLIFNDGDEVRDITGSLNELSSAPTNTSALTTPYDIAATDTVNVAAVTAQGTCNPVSTAFSCTA